MAIGLAADGPAYGRGPRDAWRRSRCGSLATLPRVALRPPPLKCAHPVGAVAHVSDLLDPAGNRNAPR